MRRLKRREVKLLASVIATLIVLIISWKQPGQNSPIHTPPPPPGYYRVIKIEDGDTITIDMQGKEERIRFIGIDTPETQDPRKPVQCFGRAASSYTKQLIGEQAVRLESDPLSSNRDRYNRLLRYVYLPDGRLVQAEILTHGYGFAYVSFPFTRSDEFLAYQTQAREQNQGLWAACEPQPNQYGGFDANPEP